VNDEQKEKKVHKGVQNLSYYRARFWKNNSSGFKGIQSPSFYGYKMEEGIQQAGSAFRGNGVTSNESRIAELERLVGSYAENAFLKNALERLRKIKERR